MVPIYRAASDPGVDEIIVVCGSQMSKTELILNIAGHRFDDGPYMPALYIAPTEKLARSMSSDRITKMLKATPALWDKLSQGHANKVTEKYIAGVRFGIGWAGSATELASHPVGLAFVDERDRMDADVNGEGDPVELVRARLETFPASKLVVVSTPTVEGASPIWSLYESGSMGKWSWNCPYCDGLFVPMLSLLKWDKGATAQQAYGNAWVECPHCEEHISDRHKTDMNNRGRFAWHVLNDAGDHVQIEERPPNRTASFWISGLASPWRSFGALARRLVDAYKSKEPERIQAAVNTGAGEVWRTRGDAPSWEAVAQLRAPYEKLTIPEGVQLITLGADVQKFGIYYSVRGWGWNVESWLIDNGFLAGETEFDNVWMMLGRILQPGYLPAGQRIIRAFIDSGYRPGDKLRRPENQVYKFCRQYAGIAYPTKGHDTLDRPCKMSRIDYSAGGRVIKGGVQLWHLNSDYYKSLIYSRVRWPAGEPGGFHLYNTTDQDYCKQLVAEELQQRPSGKRIWIRTRPDNHYLDCEVGNYAAAETLQVHALKPLDLELKSPPLQSKQQKAEKRGGGFNRSTL